VSPASRASRVMNCKFRARRQRSAVNRNLARQPPMRPEDRLCECTPHECAEHSLGSLFHSSIGIWANFTTIAGPQGSRTIPLRCWVALMV